MKKFIAIITMILVFFTSSAFNQLDNSTSTSRQDTVIHRTEVNVNFDRIEVKEKTANLEKTFAQQKVVDLAFVEELHMLNSKLPDMTVPPHEAKLAALEEEFGITKKDYLKAIDRQLRSTNFINFLVFLSGLGLVTYLLTNKRIKREPDAILKLSKGFLMIGSLFLLRFLLLSTLGVLNPDYVVIQQFLQMWS